MDFQFCSGQKIALCAPKNCPRTRVPTISQYYTSGPAVLRPPPDSEWVGSPSLSPGLYQT
eukprot:NODE_3606_length_389_cov_292.702941_g3049_i0.p1 GENE.NODE_3606_length_389_cov_292.702941_g3049_i0~~NODE_3606_length_389_cov_292.702941_g3049_i0.p1  ORF type:complete len:60 (-),score=0.33 NODE_3606_length_389_cov_292.702941_g3049_i0:109-288(-)